MESTYPREAVKAIYRRILPLLDRVGTQTRTLEHLLAEAYVLGLKDAVDIMGER